MAYICMLYKVLVFTLDPWTELYYIYIMEHKLLHIDTQYLLYVLQIWTCVPSMWYTLTVDYLAILSRRLKVWHTEHKVHMDSLFISRGDHSFVTF